MTFWARTTKNLRRPGDIEHALNLAGLLFVGLLEVHRL